LPFFSRINDRPPFRRLFRFDSDNPDNPNNDRLIFSKGHAAPLLYSLWTVAGKLSETELLTLRKFGSSLEGHPTKSFPYAEAATGSLGQGLSIGAGMAINGNILTDYHIRFLFCSVIVNGRGFSVGSNPACSIL